MPIDCLENLSVELLSPHQNYYDFRQFLMQEEQFHQLTDQQHLSEFMHQALK